MVVLCLAEQNKWNWDWDSQTMSIQLVIVKIILSIIHSIVVIWEGMACKKFHL